VQLNLSKNALTVLEARYLRRDPRGQIMETPEELFRRVAHTVAQAEAKWGEASALGKWEEKFFDMLTNFDFLPNSPTLMNAGTSLGQLSACFVLAVEDSMESIFDSLKLMALNQQSGGGTGFSFSRLRPRGDVVATTGGTSSGPVSFMRIFDCATENIKQGGKRRGANMGLLRVDHPDIEEFIDAKRDGQSFRNFNLSVGTPDAFMEAVVADRPWTLRDPRSSQPVRVLSAGELLARISSAASETGDLGLLRQADELVEHALVQPTAARHLDASFRDYELLDEIGRGGMGIVFKARQRSLNRTVALKMIRLGEYAGHEEQKRFDREAQAIARLHHPNIVQIYEIGEADGQPFLSLEFVEGDSLARRLNGTPWSASEAAPLVEQLAHAMHYAHEKGVIHRDLKPGNVLLKVDSRQRNDTVPAPQATDDCLLSTSAKIADFGLAKLAAEAGARQPETATAFGTPSYMAPEQADAKRGSVDARTDVYGLGAILYELLTGRPPFRADTPLETLKQVVTADPARPRLLNPAVPRDLETLCLKCLEKDPSRRYATAEALADDLGRFARGEPVTARPLGPVDRGWRWCRRNPVPATLTAMLGLAIVVGLAGIVLQWRRTTIARQEAVANEEQVRQLLAELVASSPITPLVEFSLRTPSVEPLHKAGNHSKTILRPKGSVRRSA
jgi:serine/threonine protein kinase